MLCAIDNSRVKKDKQLPLFSLKQVAQHNTKDSVWIVVRDKVYDVTKWLDFHPGGELALLHLAGKDATVQVTAFHPPYVMEKRLPLFLIGQLHPSDCIYTSHGKPLRDSTDNSNEINKAYVELYDKLVQGKMFETDYFFYFYLTAIYCIIAAFLAVLIDTIYVTSIQPEYRDSYTMMGLVVFTALLNAIFWHQLAFIAHDAGHNGITHQLSKDHLIGLICGNFIGGISFGWWKHNHNVHHVVTNHPEHDPDIQHMHFLPSTSKFFSKIWSTYYQREITMNKFSKMILPFQHYLYLPILLFGRINLYANSIRYLLYEKKVYRWKWEVVGLSFFVCWYGYLLSFIPSVKYKIIYVFISHAATFILHIQITLSHFAMSTEEAENNKSTATSKFCHSSEAFATRMLRTTMDIDCPKYMDWFHGGLQWQIEHHLFPRLPRHNLRTLRKLVEQFCLENSLDHLSAGFIESNILVLKRLKQVAKESENFH